MQNRNPIIVFLLGVVTSGIYSWYWAVKTKGEMNKLGEKIPTAWLWLVPVIGVVWWFWKYSEGVEHVTHEKTSSILAFIVMFLLGGIGQAIIQDSFNKHASGAQMASAPMAPMQTQTIAQNNTSSTQAYQAPVDQSFTAATPTQTEQPAAPTMQAEAPAVAVEEPPKFQ